MRKALFLLAFLVSFTVYSQNNQSPDYYLNGREINFSKVFINPLSIDSISVEKKTKNGAIYIFTKNIVFTSLSLKEVLKKYTNLTEPNDSLLFRIDGKIIDDISDIKIDDSFFIYVDIKTMSDVKYISDKFKNLTIVNVDLEKERKPIMLRGNQKLLTQFSK